MKKCLLALFLALGLCVFASTAIADVVGDFDDASGAGVDTYPGVAGEGWGGAWDYRASGGSVSRSLMEYGDTDYNAFDADNDNYLRFKVTNSGTGKGCVMRSYMGTSSDVDYAEDYTIAFSFRGDDMSTFGSGSYFNFYGDPDKEYNITTDSTFQIRVVGASSTDATRNCQWYFSDGDNAGGNTAETAWSGVYLVEGHVYDFLLTMHPEAKTWDVTVTDRDFDINEVPSTAIADPVASSTTIGLGWRGPNDGEYLSFSGRAYNSSTSLTGSVDNIRIAQVAVPEPSTLVLLAGALLGLLIWRRK